MKIAIPIFIIHCAILGTLKIRVTCHDSTVRGGLIMHTPNGFSFEFTKEEARKFIIACKKLDLNPQKVLKEAMDNVINKAKQKDAQFIIHAREYNLNQPKELTYPQSNKFVNAILEAASGRLRMSEACQLANYFHEYAKRAFHEKKDITKLAQWIWYEYSTNPLKYTLEK